MQKSFKLFLEKGFTDRQRNLYKEDIIQRWHFYFGHRFGYIAWRFGISVTTFSIIRILLTFAGLWLILLPGLDFLPHRLFGTFLIVLQKVMDYGDGALARATESSTPSGRQLDILSDLSPKMMVFCIIAYLSELEFFIILSGFLCYMYVKSLNWITFGRTFVDEHTNNPYFVDTQSIETKVNYNSTLNLLNSYPVLLYVVPLTLSLLRDQPQFPYFIELNVSLFTFYFLSNSFLFWQCLSITSK